LKSRGNVVYLPPIYDPKKIREGILELLSWSKPEEKSAVSKKEVS